MRLAAGVADELEEGEQKGEETGRDAAEGEDKGEPAGVGGGAVRGVAAEEEGDGGGTGGSDGEDDDAGAEELACVRLDLEWRGRSRSFTACAVWRSGITSTAACRVLAFR